MRATRAVPALVTWRDPSVRRWLSRLRSEQYREESHLPLLETLTGHLNALVGDPDGRIELRAGVRVPRELALPVIANHGHFVATTRLDGKLERPSDAAIDAFGFVRDHGPIVVRDHHMNGDGVGSVVLNGEIELAGVLFGPPEAQAASSEDEQSDETEVSPTHTHGLTL